MARTTINTQVIPDGTIVSADLSFPLTDFSSTGIDDNASTTALTIDSSGNISVTGTVDGRDLATDGIKLDGIEASADVTDATNVAAAGAVMDGDFTANGFMKRTGAGAYTVDTSTYLTSVSVNGLSDATITSVADNEVLAYDSTSSEWINQTASEAGLATSSQGALADTALQPADLSVTTNAAGTAALTYTSATGVFSYTPPDLSGYLTSYTETDTLNSVTGRGNSTSNSITVGDATVTGNLTVQGTTTTLNTATLDVEDKNITINYSTGDSSGSADGAGITIQDAVNSTTDATILWDATGDKFEFSHAVDVAGNITLTGTVDGRDLAIDGAKLDGIESGATADQTASEILSAILTVDGSGSGLNADYLDGQEGTYYLNYNNFTNTPTIPTNNNQLTNGAGYITSFDITTQTDPKYLRSDVDDTTSGVLTTGQVRWGTGNSYSGNPRSLVIGYSGAEYGNIGYGWVPTSTGGNYTASVTDIQSRITLYDGIQVFSSNNTSVTSGNTITWTELLDCRSNVLQYKNNNIWHAGNDGSGSGLDADTVDGIEGSNLLTLSGSQTVTGLKTFSSAGGNVFLLNDTDATNATNANIYFYFQAQGSNLGYLGYGTSSNNYLYLSNPNAPIYLAGSSCLVRNGYEVWGTDNDGSGSGLDADLLDGIQAASFLRSDAADSASGKITFTAAQNDLIEVNTTSGSPYFRFKTSGTNNGYIQFTTSDSYFWNDRTNHGIRLSSGGVPQYYNASAYQTMWYAGNDGSGSGLDADTLDGTHRSDMWANMDGAVRTNYTLKFRAAADNYAGIQFDSQVNTNTYAGFFLHYGGSSTSDVYTADGITLVADRGWLTLAQRTTSSKGVRIMSGTTSTERLKVTTGGAIEFVNGTSFTYGGNTIWHAGNDGSGSGLDADLLDGYNSGTSGANIVLRTDVSGYILHQNWIQIGNGTGLYCPNGAYFYNDTTYGWFARSSSSSNGSVRLQTSDGTNRGWFYANSSYNQGFLTNAGGWALTVDNSGNVTATGNVTAYSDLRLKEDIKPLENALAKVLQLRGVQYTRKDTKEKEIGVIAQEIENILPEVVRISDSTAQEKDKETYTDIRSVDYGRMVSVLIEAIKEQQAQINELKEKIKWQ